MPIKRRVGMMLIWILMGLYLSSKLLAVEGEMALDEVNYSTWDREIDERYKDYVKYDISDGDVMITETGKYYITGTTTTSSITVSTGATDVEIVLDNVNITLPEDIINGALNDNGKGPTEIVLLGENNLQGGGYSAAISIKSRANLIISDRSTGKLVARGGCYSAGIGTSNYTVGGHISINGGEIYAYGDSGGCGIGTGTGSKGNIITVESVTINGGNVYCEGGSKASALGGGGYSYTKYVCINAGQVIAKGGMEVSAIGRGAQQDSTQSSIDILGGTVIAYQGARKASNPNAIAAIDLFNGGSIGQEAIVIAMSSIETKAETEGTYEVSVKDVGQPFNLSIDPLNIVLQDISLIDGGEEMYFHLPQGKYQLCFESGGQLYKCDIGKAEEADVEEPTKPEGDTPKNDEVEGDSPKNDEVEGDSPKDDEVEEDSPKDDEVEEDSPKDDALEGDSPKDDEVEEDSPKDDALEGSIAKDNEAEETMPDDKLIQGSNSSTFYRNSAPQHIRWDEINFYRSKESFYIHFGIALQKAYYQKETVCHLQQSL